MATLNEHTSVLVAILSDRPIFDDTNFILSGNEFKQRNNEETTLAAVSANTHQTTSQFVYKHVSHVTKAAGSEVFRSIRKK